MSGESEAVNDGVQETIDDVRAKILHAAEIFPFMSSSMIHMAIGTSTSTKLWRPILDELVAAGNLVKTERSFKHPVSGRMQPYTIYHLKWNEYVYGPSEPKFSADIAQVA